MISSSPLHLVVEPLSPKPYPAMQGIFVLADNSDPTGFQVYYLSGDSTLSNTPFTRLYTRFSLISIFLITCSSRSTPQISATLIKYMATSASFNPKSVFFFYMHQRPRQIHRTISKTLLHPVPSLQLANEACHQRSIRHPDSSSFSESRKFPQPYHFCLWTGFHQHHFISHQSTHAIAPFGLKPLYFKPFIGYLYFTFDINTTVSICGFERLYPFCLSASIGGILAAFLAGYIPKNMPTADENPTAIKIVDMSKLTGAHMIDDMPDERI